MQSTNTLTTLPEALLLEIFSQLAPDQLSKVPRLNKFFSNLTFNNKFATFFKPSSPALLAIAKEVEFADWKKYWLFVSQEPFAKLSGRMQEILVSVLVGNLRHLQIMNINFKELNEAVEFDGLVSGEKQKILDLFFHIVKDEYAKTHKENAKVKRDIFKFGYAFTLLHWAAILGQSKDVIDQLIFSGAKKNAIAKFEGVTPLYLAAYYGHMETVKALLSHHAAIVINSSRPHSAIAAAANQEHHHIVEFLLSYIQDANCLETALLSHFVAKGQLNFVNIMLGKGAAVETYVTNPLHVAATFGHVDIIKILLAHGADVNRKNFLDGKTPLHHAAFCNKPKAVTMLLANGANPTIEDNANKTPIDYAIEQKHYPLVQLIKELKTQNKVADLIAQKKPLTEDKIAIRIANLFDSYAHPPLFSMHYRHHKLLARIISYKLYANPEWNFAQCKQFISNQIEDTLRLNPKAINPLGTLSGLLVHIDKLEPDKRISMRQLS